MFSILYLAVLAVGVAGVQSTQHDADESWPFIRIEQKGTENRIKAYENPKMWIEFRNSSSTAETDAAFGTAYKNEDGKTCAVFVNSDKSAGKECFDEDVLLEEVDHGRVEFLWVNSKHSRPEGYEPFRIGDSRMNKLIYLANFQKNNGDVFFGGITIGRTFRDILFEGVDRENEAGVVTVMDPINEHISILMTKLTVDAVKP